MTQIIITKHKNGMLYNARRLMRFVDVDVTVIIIIIIYLPILLQLLLLNYLYCRCFCNAGFGVFQLASSYESTDDLDLFWMKFMTEIFCDDEKSVRIQVFR